MAKQLLNELLKRLPEREFSLLRGKLEQVELSVGESIYEPFNTVDYLYFPEDSMISLISVTRDGLTVEVGVVGYEGLLGAGVVFAGETIPYRATVQVGGKAHKVHLKTLRKLIPEAGRLQEEIFSYFHAIHAQVSQSATCNKFHTVQERMAKWLLLSMDRTGKNTFDYTHEFLSMILGARRTTVSRTLTSLQSLGLIHKRRASIRILQRKGLEALTCECYEIITVQLQQFN